MVTARSAFAFPHPSMRVKWGWGNGVGFLEILRLGIAEIGFVDRNDLPLGVSVEFHEIRYHPGPDTQ